MTPPAQVHPATLRTARGCLSGCVLALALVAIVLLLAGVVSSTWHL